MRELEKAARMALEALEWWDRWSQQPSPETKQAITALRRALEQQPVTATYTCPVCGVPMQMEKHEQQPADEHVAIMTVLHLKDRTEIGYGPYSAGYDLPTGEYKLYTRPQPAAPAIPDLTHDQWDEWQDKWQVMLQREALDDLRTMLAAAPEQQNGGKA